MTRRLPLAALIALGLLLTACSSPDTGTPGTPDTAVRASSPISATPPRTTPTPTPAPTPAPAPTKTRTPTPAPAPATRTASPRGADGLPTRRGWLADVAAVMSGSTRKLDRVIDAAPRGSRLAIVLDIDNTSIATEYDWPKPVAKTLTFARHAVARGVAVYFVTGRTQGSLGSIRPVLKRAGYRYVDICGRKSGESLATGKQRCRAAIAAKGVRIIANVGNRPTDFVGKGYGLRFKLPDYGKRLS